MRLKQGAPALAVRNDNQHSPVDSTILSNSTTDGYNATENASRHRDTLQWCNTINTIQHQQRENQKQSENNVQRQQPTQQRHVYNINNNLAASLRGPEPPSRTRGTVSSLCSESSPDDSLLDYEDAHQSCSSADTSPQDEERGFDVSDSESLSDDGNLSGSSEHPKQDRGQNRIRTRGPRSHRGIVNPNYPGFQHLAHTLDYTIKAACSDTDCTDDDLDIDQANTRCVPRAVDTDVNSLNNNNNNNNNPEEDVEYKIDSVNRLDSVENIQKVFYDKPKLNLPFECEEKRNNCLDSAEEASVSNLASDEDLEGNLFHDSSDSSDIKLNIVESTSRCDIIGDFGKEIEQELGRIQDSAHSNLPTEQKETDCERRGAMTRANATNLDEGSASKANYTQIVEFQQDVAANKHEESNIANISIRDECHSTDFRNENKENMLVEATNADERENEKEINGADDKEVLYNGNEQLEESPSHENTVLNEASNYKEIGKELNKTNMKEVQYNGNVQSVDSIKESIDKNVTNKPEENILMAGSTNNHDNGNANDKAISNITPKTSDVSLSKEVNHIISQPILKPSDNISDLTTQPEDSSKAEITKEISEILNSSLESALSLQLTRGVEHDLEEAVEKLTRSKDLSPSALKYNIEPNSSEPFEKVKVEPKTVIKDSAVTSINSNEKLKASDAFLSGAKEVIKPPEYLRKKAMPVVNIDLKPRVEYRIPDNEHQVRKMPLKMVVDPRLSKEEITKNEKEKDDDSALARRQEMEMNFVKKRRDINQQYGSLVTIPRRELGGKNRDVLMNRRSLPVARNKKRNVPDMGGFDVYNIETAMPKIDLDAIESHLRAARDEERRRRTDREEIRRRLAMGSEDDYYNGCDRPGRKPSLQARLQSGMNLQICFMNETVSDTESPNSDSENPVTEIKRMTPPNKNKVKMIPQKPVMTPRPVSLPLGTTQPFLKPFTQPMTEADFFARQARLQTEARMALAQAKEMAHMQMEIERQRQKKSPITEMVRSSMEKVGIPFPEERRRLSRQILTDMNLAQLQVIVNDLHTQIETLNENLVRYLMERDDLHMEQDSMLVDIEDLTRYLGAKEQTVKDQKLSSQNNNIPPPSPAPASPLSALNNTMKPRLHRIASLVKK